MSLISMTCSNLFYFLLSLNLAIQESYLKINLTEKALKIHFIFLLLRLWVKHTIRDQLRKPHPFKFINCLISNDHTQ